MSCGVAWMRYHGSRSLSLLGPHLTEDAAAVVVAIAEIFCSSRLWTSVLAGSIDVDFERRKDWNIVSRQKLLQGVLGAVGVWI